MGRWGARRYMNGYSVPNTESPLQLASTREILIGNAERDLVLKAQYSSGEMLTALAQDFALTPQRVFQITKSIN